MIFTLLGELGTGKSSIVEGITRSSGFPINPHTQTSDIAHQIDDTTSVKMHFGTLGQERHGRLGLQTLLRSIVAV